MKIMRGDAADSLWLQVEQNGSAAGQADVYTDLTAPQVIQTKAMAFFDYGGFPKTNHCLHYGDMMSTKEKVQTFVLFYNTMPTSRTSSYVRSYSRWQTTTVC